MGGECQVESGERGVDRVQPGEYPRTKGPPRDGVWRRARPRNGGDAPARGQ